MRSRPTIRKADDKVRKHIAALPPPHLEFWTEQKVRGVPMTSLVRSAMSSVMMFSMKISGDAVGQTTDFHIRKTGPRASEYSAGDRC
jgi:hypothetical protein